ncbi:MAG: IscS subfamily cysteine desulfurase [Spirochaetia bacterium]|jgi:cysteine desulfurase|nr:IscS subfamily cysteine desulfurase [Spirochaetia bacterium]
MNEQTIYLDNNATTPLHPEVIKELTNSFKNFGNPSSMHFFGRESTSRVEWARQQVALLINAREDEILFTGGGSESNNMVLKQFLPVSATRERNKVITSVIEHPSVLETVRELEKEGMEAVFIGVDSKGRVNIDKLEKAVDNKTALVSIMLANNEIGTIEDIKKISKIVHASGALMHTDAVQALGKIKVDVIDLGVDFLSFSGHKFYGPKGVGGLFIKHGLKISSLIHGGHQENGRRAGTINGPGIAGVGKAAEMANLELEEESLRLDKLRNKLEIGLMDSISNIYINGDIDSRLPGTLNLSFPGAEGESILLYLDIAGVAVSTGSACATGSLEPSHVLIATGVDIENAHGSIRFSFGKFNVEKDVDYVLSILPGIIEKIRMMSTFSSK